MNIEREGFRAELIELINSYKDKMTCVDLVGELYATLKQAEFHYVQELFAMNEKASEK